MISHFCKSTIEFCIIPQLRGSARLDTRHLDLSSDLAPVPVDFPNFHIRLSQEGAEYLCAALARHTINLQKLHTSVHDIPLSMEERGQEFEPQRRQAHLGYNSCTCLSSIVHIGQYL